MPSSQLVVDHSTKIIELTTQTTVAALISNGNFSRVYLCYDHSSVKRSASASKVVKVYLRKTAEIRSQRIMNEKKAWHRANLATNPYISKLLGTLKDSIHLYFVMTAYHCGHICLHIRNSESGRFSPIVARNYSTEILSALLAIIKCGCVHRDIKASNCLIDRYGHVKICDFGASKVLFEPEEYSAVMSDGAVMDMRTYTLIGTVQYMAPEIIARTSGYSFEVDWWAFGVLLYEMMCGSPPTFQDVPSQNNKEAVAAVVLGLWPTQEASSIALAATQSRIKSMRETPSTEIHGTSYRKYGPWCPTPSANEELILFSSIQHINAWNLIRGLLVACPHDRLGPRAPNLLKNHEFFHGVNWDDVENGVSPPPDVEFNRSLGFLDLEDDVLEERTPEEIEIDAKLFKDFST